MKFNWKTAFGYWFVHFAVEVLCFYTIYTVFNGGALWWIVSILYDALAFVPQVMIGDFCERHPKFRVDFCGGIMLVAGATLILAGSPLFAIIIGLLLMTIGNGCMHISGALATLRASNGGLSESSIFVGGGSFGVITGRLLSKVNGIFWLPILLMVLGTVVAVLVDNDLCRTNGKTRAELFDFTKDPCRHSITANRPGGVILLILASVVMVRAYIGYGLPTAWNTTTVQTIFLFSAMGTGKMLGGVFSDIFGARRVGVLSCLLAVPALLVSNHIMWLSLIGVALFSMTMAITLGGLTSALPRNPGVAFGITTVGLFLGTAVIFFFAMPNRMICDILIVVLSLASASGLWYCLKPGRK